MTPPPADLPLVVHAFNGLDAALLIFCLLSAGVGFVRGVTREILSVSGWIGAIIGTVYLLPFVRPWMHTVIPNTIAADLIASGVIFVFLLTLFLVISQSLSARVKRSVLGGLDRSLGVLFGLLRGGVLICLGYAVLVFFLPPAQQPDFLRTAKSLPWIQRGEKILKSIIPAEFLAISSDSLNRDTLPSPQEDIEKMVEALSTLRPTASPPPPPGKK